jgi:hypothetical protein
LAGLGVEFTMVNDLDPGEERFVELRQSGHGRECEFGQKIRLDEAEETLDFSASFGIVGGTENALDAQSSADGILLAAAEFE